MLLLNFDRKNACAAFIGQQQEKYYDKMSTLVTMQLIEILQIVMVYIRAIQN